MPFAVSICESVLPPRRDNRCFTSKTLIFICLTNFYFYEKLKIFIHKKLFYENLENICENYQQILKCINLICQVIVASFFWSIRNSNFFYIFKAETYILAKMKVVLFWFCIFRYIWTKKNYENSESTPTIQIQA